MEVDRAGGGKRLKTHEAGRQESLEGRKKPEVIDLVGEDDDSSIVAIEQQGAGVGAENAQDDDEEEEEVMIVDPPPPVVPAYQEENSQTDNDDDEEIRVIASTQHALPHMRQHCTMHPFTINGNQNSTTCSLCYCYVCDVPVTDCKQWQMHCQATDKAQKWRDYRQQKRQQKQSAKEKLFFEGTLKCAKAFKLVLTAMMQYCTRSMYLKCDSDGIGCQVLGKDRVTVSCFRFDRAAFENYHCEKSTSFCIPNIQLLVLNLKDCTKKSDVLHLRATESIFSLELERVDPDKPNVDFSVAVIEGEDRNELVIPSDSYLTRCRFPSTQFHQIVDGLFTICNRGIITISSNEGGSGYLRFSTERRNPQPGMAVKGSFLFRKSDRNIKIDNQKNSRESCTAHFDSERLSFLIRKTYTLASTINMNMVLGGPMLLEYNLSLGSARNPIPCGFFRIYVAPFAGEKEDEDG